MINVDEIRRFFTLLDPNETIWTVCFLDKSSKSAIPGLGTLIAPLDEIIKQCQRLEAEGVGFTLHFNLNRTKISGRKKADIESVRCFAIDLDREVSKDWLSQLILKYNPSIIVESSPGRYHVYWQSSSQISLENWAKVQLALASAFQGDSNLSQVSKTLRVPGTERFLKDGAKTFLPYIYYQASNINCVAGMGDVDKLFPWWREYYAKGLEITKEQRKSVLKSIRQYKSRSNSQEQKGEFQLDAQEGQRTISLYAFVKELASDIETDRSYEEIFQAAIEINKKFTPPLDGSEVESVVRWAYRNGAEWKEKKIARRAKHTKGKLGPLADSGAELRQPAISRAENDGCKDQDDDCQDGNDKHGDLVKGISETAIASDGCKDILSGLNCQEGTNRKNFDYDFTLGNLKTAPFSKLSVVDRVLQRFGKYLLRVGRTVYAFDPFERVWRSQRGSTEVLALYAKECLLDTVLHEGFEAQHGMTQEGLSEAKLQASRDRFLTPSTIRDVIQCVLSEPDIRRAEPNIFDSNPLFFHCANGVLDLAKGEIREAIPEDYLFQRSSVVWDREASQALWIEFVEQVFEFNENPCELGKLLQELFGYSLTGLVSAQKIFVHHGEGCNGKSKVLTALAGITGSYSTKLVGNTMSRAKSGIQREFERIGAKSEGKRVVVIDDLDTATQWNEGYIKLLTERVIPARRLYEEERDIINQAKFHIGCNTIPTVEGENFGMLRRLMLIPYNRRFESNSAADIRIEKMLAASRSGILNWAIDGFKMINQQDITLSEPEETKMFMEDYKKENFTNEDKVIKAINQVLVKGQEKVKLRDILERIRPLLPEMKLNDRYIGNILTNQLKIQSKRERTSEGRIIHYFIKFISD